METSSVRITGAQRACLLLTALCLTGVADSRAESSSASFVLRQSTLDAGVESSESMGFRLDASCGQELAIGTSSSPYHVLQSGYWGFLGSGIVPVILTVNRSSATPDHIDLSWSGNNPPYEVYESSDCGAVFSGFLTTVSSNSLVDLATPAATLVCYNVLPTAPGP